MIHKILQRIIPKNFPPFLSHLFILVEYHNILYAMDEVLQWTKEKQHTKKGNWKKLTLEVKELLLTLYIFWQVYNVELL